MYTKIYLCTEISQGSCCVTVSSSIKALSSSGKLLEGEGKQLKYLQKVPETVQIY